MFFFTSPDRGSNSAVPSAQVAEFSLIERLRPLGPYEDWLATGTGSDAPELALVRRPDPVRPDAAALAARLGPAAERARLVEHPLVLTCFGVAPDGAGQPQQVQEVVSGVDLARLMSASASLSTRLELPLGVWIARQILEALDHAHSLEVLHGVLAPQHVFFTRTGAVKVDFGLSCGTVNEHDPQWRTQIADPRYAHGAASTSADVRGCAVMLYEMLTGRPVDDDRQRLLRLVPNAPPALDEKLEAALSPAKPIDARTFELELTELFYGPLDADDESDGSEALARWVTRVVPPDRDIVVRYAPTNAGDPSRAVGVPGAFTMAMSEREGPVRPKDFGTDDYEVAEPTNPNDSWSPGMELRAKLDKAMGLSTPSEPKTMVAEYLDAPTDVPTDVPTAPGLAEDDAAATAVIPPPTPAYAVAPPPARPPASRLIWFLAGFTLTLALLIVQRWLREG